MRYGMKLKYQNYKNPDRRKSVRGGECWERKSDLRKEAERLVDLQK